jgi:hypothetical protein
MEKTFEKVNCSIEKRANHTLRDASEILLANLPILILGFVIVMAVTG